ncbi:MAG TPA: L-aspartate oxidase [Phycisphaerae bacterium]|nr:L-aspartate oxidase [Phycisphaerae bacterium]HOM51264.1 L-aspartate oxidase [Phycisphaerae bacterium]HPP26771.1 L-aspartate oxidase [Phycisphaerae bacterium]
MLDIYDSRRYLTRFDVRRIPNLFTDFLVVGSGVAGLRAAIETAKHGPTLLITKSRIDDSNTAKAQGGIAVVMAASDKFESHIQDTLTVGCGLCDRAAVERIVREGPRRIEELIEWGALFDRRKKQLLLGLEGGHSAPRIVHAMGDATGREVANTLIRVARGTEQLRIFEECFAIDLLVVDGRCCGVSTYHRHFGHQIFWAKQTILASGGCGQVYRETTNPEVATGDGHAMAFRAGLPLRDMEMVQFHPTTLYIAGAARSLISEAVRGEGAHLVDRTGRRFMPEYHPAAELAPRDVVSRAILTEMARQDATCMYLSVAHLNIEKFRKRFPSISRLCEQFDIDLATQPIPVRPAAHYMVGGVKVDNEAWTGMPGLFACGEAASSGVHGANRLASNSLLEGLVFGAVAGQNAVEAANGSPGPLEAARLVSEIEASTRTMLDVADIRNSLRSVMWRNVGIERQEARLNETVEIINFWGKYVMDKLFDQQIGWETQNMLTVARLIAIAARERKESRGVHFRSDYPEPDPALDGRHLILQRTENGLNIRME